MSLSNVIFFSIIGLNFLKASISYPREYTKKLLVVSAFNKNCPNRLCLVATLGGHRSSVGSVTIRSPAMALDVLVGVRFGSLHLAGSVMSSRDESFYALKRRREAIATCLFPS
jgi:hypothetical protein